jgi:glutathione S-transferase
MKRILYDLAAADPALRFSPYCWRIKLALAHKNLPFETIPWRFTEKDKLAFSGQTKVPVLVDGETIIHDSQAIAEYLEITYANQTSLFGDAASRALTYFIKQWTELTLHPVIVKIVLPDIYPQIDQNDQPYFRQSREAVFGKTIEMMAAERDSHLPAFDSILAPIRRTLAAQSFIAGNAPSYADHIVFGALQWARLMSRLTLFDDQDAITLWMAALLNTYGLSQ